VLRDLEVQAGLVVDAGRVAGGLERLHVEVGVGEAPVDVGVGRGVPVLEFVNISIYSLNYEGPH